MCPCGLGTLGGDVSAVIGDAVVNDFAGDVDDPSPLLFFHTGKGVFCEVVGTEGESIEHTLVVLLRVLFYRGHLLWGRGIDDENI